MLSSLYVTTKSPRFIVTDWPEGDLQPTRNAWHRAYLLPGVTNVNENDVFPVVGSKCVLPG